MPKRLQNLNSASAGPVDKIRRTVTIMWSAIIGRQICICFISITFFGNKGHECVFTFMAFFITEPHIQTEHREELAKCLEESSRSFWYASC